MESIIPIWRKNSKLFDSSCIRKSNICAKFSVFFMRCDSKPLTVNNVALVYWPHINWWQPRISFHYYWSLVCGWYVWKSWTFMRRVDHNENSKDNKNMKYGYMDGSVSAVSVLMFNLFCDCNMKKIVRTNVCKLQLQHLWADMQWKSICIKRDTVSDVTRVFFFFLLFLLIETSFQ